MYTGPRQHEVEAAPTRVHDSTLSERGIPKLVWKPFHLKNEPGYNTPEYREAEWWATVRTWELSPKQPADKRMRKHRTRAEQKEYREARKWLNDHREKPTKSEAASIEAAYTKAVRQGFGQPQEPTTTVDPANPYGWTKTEAEVVRMHEAGGLSAHEIGRRRGTSHVAALKSLKNAKRKAAVVTPDTPLPGVEVEPHEHVDFHAPVAATPKRKPRMKEPTRCEHCGRRVAAARLEEHRHQAHGVVTANTTHPGREAERVDQF